MSANPATATSITDTMRRRICSCGNFVSDSSFDESIRRGVSPAICSVCLMNHSRALARRKSRVKRLVKPEHVARRLASRAAHKAIEADKMTEFQCVACESLLTYKEILASARTSVKGFHCEKCLKEKRAAWQTN